jgi:hypothetical protein
VSVVLGGDMLKKIVFLLAKVGIAQVVFVSWCFSVMERIVGCLEGEWKFFGVIFGIIYFIAAAWYLWWIFP